MEFDRNGRVYWESLTLKEKFEWDFLDIDPTVKRRHGKTKLCIKHFETYTNKCPKCSKHFDQSVYEYMINNDMDF